MMTVIILTPTDQREPFKHHELEEILHAAKIKNKNAVVTKGPKGRIASVKLTVPDADVAAIVAVLARYAEDVYFLVIGTFNDTLKTFDGTEASLTTYLTIPGMTEEAYAAGSSFAKVFNVDGTMNFNVAPGAFAAGYSLYVVDGLPPAPNHAYMELRAKFIQPIGVDTVNVAMSNSTLYGVLGITNSSIGASISPNNVFMGVQDGAFHVIKLEFVNETTMRYYVDGVLINEEVFLGPPYTSLNIASLQSSFPNFTGSTSGMVIDYLTYTTKV